MSAREPRLKSARWNKLSPISSLKWQQLSRVALSGEKLAQWSATILTERRNIVTHRMGQADQDVLPARVLVKRMEVPRLERSTT